jgi:Family of unknown function (DUF5681)
MTDAPKHAGGKFRKGVSGNPGGKKRIAAPQALQAAPQVGSNPQAQPEVEQPSNSGRNSDGTFAKGNNANPAGKSKGTRHAATRLAEALIDGSAKELVDKAVDMALAGDPTAMRLVLDRLCPPRRERTVTLDMPSIKSATDLIAAAAALTEATAAGDITPSEAASLSTLVGNVAKAVETVEIVARLAKLEERLAVKGSNP